MPTPLHKPEAILEVAVRAGWTRGLLAQEGLPDASLDFFWGEGDYGAVALTAGKYPERYRAVCLFQHDDLPDSEAEDQGAETRRFVKRADEIMVRLKDEVRKALATP